MNRKITALVLSAFVLGALSVRAQTPVPTPIPVAPGSSWTFTSAFVSQYMLRGVRRGGPSFEPNLEFGSGALALGLWTNFPIKDKVAGQSDPEFEPYGSYTFDLVKDRLTLQPEFILYAYPNAKKSDGFYLATFEPSLAFNWMPADGCKFTPKIYRDVVLKQTLFEFNAAFNLPLNDVGIELDFLGTIGTFKATDALEDTSPAAKNWGNYWLLGVTVPFQVVKDTQKLLLGLAYTKGSDNFLKQGTRPQSVNPGAVGRGVVTVSYAITF